MISSVFIVSITFSVFGFTGGKDSTIHLFLGLLIKFVAAEMGADQLPLRHEAIQILAGLRATAMT